MVETIRSVVQDGSKLPPSFKDNPIVRAASPDELVFPVALFMDGLPYSETDSVNAVWLVNMITGKRSILATIRKRITCACGCRGWCTFYPLFAFLRQCFVDLTDGIFPLTRHDGSAWWASDSLRAILGGTRMKAKAVLSRAKGDWLGFCEQMGYPTWQTVGRPCPCCNTFGVQLQVPCSCKLDNLPFPRKRRD